MARKSKGISVRESCTAKQGSATFHAVLVRTTLGCVVAVCTLWLVSLAYPKPADAAEDELRAKRSISIGFPWRGKLVRGWQLRQSDYVHYTGEYRANGHFFGTWELVQLLERAARRVAFRHPGARLAVGELSARHGGRLAGHRSHENGRDVDIAFYMTDASGNSVHSWSFGNVGRDGRGSGANAHLRFDDARNWELVAKLVADGDARVQRIFVANTIQARLLSEARRRTAPQVLIERAKHVMVEPTHGHPHRNHFHVRIYCAPADQRMCRDSPPFWPWYPGDLNQLLGPKALALGPR